LLLPDDRQSHASQMLVALPAGFLADRHRRDVTLRIASAMGFMAMLCFGASLLFNLPLWTLFVSLALLGSYRGLNNPPVESIFADSVPTGHRWGCLCSFPSLHTPPPPFHPKSRNISCLSLFQGVIAVGIILSESDGKVAACLCFRSSAYTVKYVVMNLASCAGPVLSLVMFAHFGDVWDVSARFSSCGASGCRTQRAPFHCQLKARTASRVRACERAQKAGCESTKATGGCSHPFRRRRGSRSGCPVGVLSRKSGA
jgi:MFS family permease